VAERRFRCPQCGIMCRHSWYCSHCGDSILAAVALLLAALVIFVAIWSLT